MDKYLAVGVGGVLVRVFQRKLKAGRLETQEEPMFQFESEGGNKPVSPFEGTWAGGILLLGEESSFCSIHLFN